MVVVGKMVEPGRIKYLWKCQSKFKITIAACLASLVKLMHRRAELGHRMLS